jgi:uncharacterized protein
MTIPWRVKQFVKKIPELKDPILIEGLPGIGNVGKIAVDFLIDELQAKPIYSFHSYNMPNSVFVNDKNLVELPSIILYAVQRKRKRDILILAGDIQPVDEVSSYTFTEHILKEFQKIGGKEIITLGGIGLSDVPERPRVFCTGTKRKMINDFKKGLHLQTKLYGVVGPIVGVSGLLVGLAPEYKMDALALLCETHGHPMYLGIKGARELLTILDKKYSLKINVKDLEKEIERIEEEILKRREEIMEVQEQNEQAKRGERISYIG